MFNRLTFTSRTQEILNTPKNNLGQQYKEIGAHKSLSLMIEPKSPALKFRMYDFQP